MTSRTLFLPLLLMLMLWLDVLPLCSIPLVLPLIPALASGARMFSQLCFGALISFFSALLPLLLLLLLLPPSFPLLHLFFTLANLRWRQRFDGGGVRLSSRLNGERMRKTLNSSARFLFLSSLACLLASWLQLEVGRYSRDALSFSLRWQHTGAIDNPCCTSIQFLHLQAGRHSFSTTAAGRSASSFC